MPREEFDEFVSEFLEQHGGIEEAIDVAKQNIERTQWGVKFKNGQALEGYQGLPEFWALVLDELYYKINMN